jgi:hypothetical protein
MSWAFLERMARLEDEAFTFFGRSRLCPLCWIYHLDAPAAPIVVVQETSTRVWTLVHGEMPVACWLDASLGDELDVRQFRRDFASAVNNAHWH